MIVTRPVVVVKAVMPSGEPFGLRRVLLGYFVPVIDEARAHQSGFTAFSGCFTLTQFGVAFACAVQIGMTDPSMAAKRMLGVFSTFTDTNRPS